MPSDDALDALAEVGEALPAAADFMPFAPSECPDCGGTVWITPHIDWTADAACHDCGWGITIDPDWDSDGGADDA